MLDTRKLRVITGLTQKEVAANAGLNEKQVCQIENGLKSSLEQRIRVANATGAKVHVFVEEPTNKLFNAYTSKLPNEKYIELMGYIRKIAKNENTIGLPIEQRIFLSNYINANIQVKREGGKRFSLVFLLENKKESFQTL